MSRPTDYRSPYAFLFPARRLLELMGAFDRSSRSRPGYMIRADVGENTQVGIGLCGSWGQHIHAALECDGVPNFVRTVEFGPENTASRQLGL